MASDPKMELARWPLEIGNWPWPWGHMYLGISRRAFRRLDWRIGAMNLGSSSMKDDDLINLISEHDEHGDLAIYLAMIQLVQLRLE